MDDKILIGGKINNPEHKLAKADQNNYTFKKKYLVVSKNKKKKKT
jgi:hypothetical protein